MIRTILATGVAAIALAVSAPTLADDHAPASGISAPQIEYTQWELDNGLTVLALQDDSTATVTTSMWYDIGSKLDPEGRSGFAHLFEHILSRKTENMTYNMITPLTADVGGTRNASNSPDRTNYFETVPAEYLETMLWTHRERMAFPVVDQDVFENERGVVKEELRQRVLAPPYGRFSRFVLPENAYDVLPQRRPGIGSIEELDSATLDDARAFFQAYYGPDTATLIVAGNFDMDELRALVDRYFADIPPRANPVPLEITLTEPERTEPRFVTATAPNVPLPLVGATWKAPGAAHPDTPVLEVIDAIMAGGENSRLHNALIRSGKAVQAVQFSNASEEAGSIAQFAVINPTADADEVIGLLAAERERLRSEPVTEAELTEAKTELFAQALRRRETARGRAFELGEALVLTGNPRAADDRIEAIAAVTAEDVMRVAEQYLDPNKRVELRYVSGEDDPSSYANPYPMPEYRTLPPATGEPRQVKPEGEREAPPAPGAVPEVRSAEIVDTSLANGIRVVATQTGEVPIATMTIIFPGGSASDARATAGAAQFAAGLADKGTATMSAPEIAARLESLGASFGAFAGADGTRISLTAPVATMAQAGEVMAQIVRGAAYPDEEFQRERKRALDGLAVSLKDPGALAGYVTRVAAYGDAPYGNLSDGTPESLAALTRDDLLEHRRTYWHPGAAQIVVSGGIAPDMAVEMAGELFGDWTSESAAPAAIDDPAGEKVAPRTIVVDMPDAGQAAVYVTTRAVSRKDDDYFALELANSVLGGGSGARLFEEIRTKRALSYGSYSGFGDRADEATLTASAQTKNETADEVMQIILNELGRLGSEPFEEDLLGKRRTYLAGGYARSLETSSGFNAIVAGLLQQGLEPGEAAQYAARLNAVDAAAAGAAAKTYADPAGATVVIVGNAAEFLDDVRELRGEVEVIPARELNLSSATLR